VVSAPRRGAGGGRCSDRRIRPAPTAAAGILRSASGPAPPAGRCPPSAPRRHLPAALTPGVVSTWSPSATKTASNAAVNFGSRSRTRNRNRPTRSSRAMSRLQACWATHSPGWLRCHPQYVDPPGRDLDHEQHVQPFEQHRVHGEAGPPPARSWPAPGGAAARSAPTAWALVRHPPGGGWPRRCWPRSCSRGGPARHGGGGNPGSGSPWPSAGPAGGAGRHGRTPTTVWVAPAAPDQILMPAQQRLGPDEHPVPPRARWQPGESGQDRAVSQSNRGRTTCRRSTATSCRSTSSSALLVAERRASSTSHPSSWRKIR
jgi:hypothetical protein